MRQGSPGVGRWRRGYDHGTKPFKLSLGALAIGRELDAPTSGLVNRAQYTPVPNNGAIEVGRSGWARPAPVLPSACHPWLDLMLHERTHVAKYVEGDRKKRTSRLGRPPSRTTAPLRPAFLPRARLSVA
jgi:hypothetical protein